MKRRWLVVLVVWGAAFPAWADEPKKAAKPHPVPYRLTDTQHILVRVKINDKGPFNFIVDTGAPIMFVATAVGKKIGLHNEGKGLAVIDKLEFEGGLVQTKVKCRVETPFQLEGMNGMGLAGAELHGIIGYTVLARYRMQFDFTKDKMLWTPLAFDPPPPVGLGPKAGAQGGLEMIGTLMKFVGFLSGMKPAGPPQPRGFLGMEVAEGKETLTIGKVLESGPASTGGLKAGDVLLEVDGKKVKTAADLQRLTAQIVAGQTIVFIIRRDEEKQEVKITAGDGL